MRYPSRDHGGYALLSATILMLVIIGLAAAFLDQLYSRAVASRSVRGAFTAVQLADAGIRKALYCLNATSGANCGGSYGILYAGETNVAFGDGTFTIAISGSGATRNVTSTGRSKSGQKTKVGADASTVPDTDHPDFAYALQAGGSGAHLENNSSITGTIYSNGDVTCQSANAVITGDAYSTKASGLIDSCNVKFDAHADRVLNGKVLRDAYYRDDPSDIGGTTVTGTKRPGSSTPIPQPLPTLNLGFWRQSAENGGTISGNYSPADNSDIGPVRINGDLIMDNNVDVTVKGPIWVRGDITTGNNSTFTLDSSFGNYSTAILADDPSNPSAKGKIVITNNTGIYGSGNPQSHIMFASTNTSLSDTSPAMSVANNANGAVFYALSGTLRLENNAGARSLAGERLFLDQNAIVTYVESDFAGPFSNSPSGKWRLVQGSWREMK